MKLEELPDAIYNKETELHGIEDEYEELKDKLQTNEDYERSRIRINQSQVKKTVAEVDAEIRACKSVKEVKEQLVIVNKDRKKTRAEFDRLCRVLDVQKRIIMLQISLNNAKSPA